MWLFYSDACPVFAFIAGIAARLGYTVPPREADCTMDPGYDYFQPNSPSVPASSATECCQLCSAQLSCTAFTYTLGNCYLKPNNAGRIADTKAISGICSQPVLPSNILYDDGSNLTRAAEVAAAADTVIVVVGTTSSEGHDRPNLAFPGDQDNLVFAIAAVQPNTIVACVNPGSLRA
jgi:hypothetical protein